MNAIKRWIFSDCYSPFYLCWFCLFYTVMRETTGWQSIAIFVTAMVIGSLLDALGKRRYEAGEQP